MLWLWLACARDPTFGERPGESGSSSDPPDASPTTPESGLAGETGRLSTDTGRRPDGETAGSPAETASSSDTGRAHTATGVGDSGVPGSTWVEEGRLQVVGRYAPCPRPVEDRRFDRQTLPRTERVADWDHWAGGLVAVDVDADGQEELVLLDERGMRVYRQEARSWVLAPEWVPEVDLFRPAGISAADADGDGDPDLVITQYGAGPVFLRNVGARWVAEAVGLPTRFVDGTSPSWGDLDGDGDLDLALAAYGAYPAVGRAPAPDPSALLLNRGDGTFEDASALLPTNVQDGLTFLLAWLDLDGDSRPELLALNDLRLRPTVSLAWDGAQFREWANGFHPNFDSMGLAVGDWNGDGRPDLVESSIYVVSFMTSVADPGAPGGAWYFDASVASGLLLDPARQGAGFGWGVAAGDLDHDGDEDLHLVLGHHDGFNETLPVSPPLPAADHLWLREPSGQFVEVGADPRWGLDDDGVGRGLLMRDLDGDGWLDLVKAQLDGPDLAYWSRCGAGGWITVDLRDETSLNRQAVGAKVVVEAGEQRWTRWQTAGSTSLFGGSPGPLHIGVGPAPRIDRVLVTWPEGTTEVVATDVASATALKVTRRER